MATRVVATDLAYKDKYYTNKVRDYICAKAS